MKLWDDIKGMFGRKEQAPNEVAAPPAASAFVYKVDEKQDRERDSPEDFTSHP